MPRIKGPPEGKNPPRDESRSSAEPVTLDAFFKVFKESLEIQNQRFDKLDQRFKDQDLNLDQRFDELTKRMDVIDQRYKVEDQCFEHREQPFRRRDEMSVEMKGDIRSNCQTGGLPGQQVGPEGEDAYTEESGESNDDSTTYGENTASPSGKLEKEPDLVPQTCTEQKENNPVTISRHVEGDNDGGSSPHEPTLRDPPHGENLNVEPVLQSAGVKDGETSVDQEEAISTPFNTQQGRSNSSQVAAVNATENDKCGAARNRLALQNKTVNTTRDENKFFDPGGEQDWSALQSRPLHLSGRA